jgi:hypothetical protein
MAFTTRSGRHDPLRIPHQVENADPEFHLAEAIGGGRRCENQTTPHRIKSMSNKYIVRIQKNGVIKEVEVTASSPRKKGQSRVLTLFKKSENFLGWQGQYESNMRGRFIM